jgi:hypothetical protein
MFKTQGKGFAAGAEKNHVQQTPIKLSSSAGSVFFL